MVIFITVIYSYLTIICWIHVWEQMVICSRYILRWVPIIPPSLYKILLLNVNKTYALLLTRVILILLGFLQIKNSHLSWVPFALVLVSNLMFFLGNFCSIWLNLLGYVLKSFDHYLHVQSNFFFIKHSKYFTFLTSNMWCDRNSKA